MGRAFSDIAFTATVRAVQTRMGSRADYAPLDRTSDRRDRLTDSEAEFIEAADHFYQATVGETGWPYVQHRGGPAGFLKVLDEKTIGFADFRGNVQYISVGNLSADNRVALILMDVAKQRRLKILGRARMVEVADDAALIERLRTPGYDAKIERAMLITVEAYDWNCPQHITPRFTEKEIAAMIAPLRTQLQKMKEQQAETTTRTAPSSLGTGPLKLTITGIRQLTPRVRSYELRCADGTSLPPVQAGAHIDIPVRLTDGTLTTRCYSIASDPKRTEHVEIAVLREDEGHGGSVAVHDDFRLGLVLNCGLLRNDFMLHDDVRPTMLIAGGIGITPIKAMAHALDERGSQFSLHYAVRSKGEAAYLDQLREAFGERLVVYPVADGLRLDVATMIATAAPDTVFYICGPARLIDAVRDAARVAGVADERVRFERFTSAILHTDDRPVTVTLSKSRKIILVAADRSILEAVQAAGVNAPASCRIGNCSTCAVKVLAGSPDHRDEALTEQQKQDEGLMCICVSRALTAELTLDL